MLKFIPVRAVHRVASIAALLAIGLGTTVVASADNGPDVSSWQHPNGAAINWASVHSDGHSFAIVKATESTSYVNPYFANDWSAIRANGMYRGAYHFARPADSSGAAQAAHFLSAIGNATEGGNLPPALDLEVSDGLSPTDLINWTQSFVAQVEAQTGRKPMIYSYPSFWRNQMANTTAFSSYPLWLADWTGTGSPNYPLPGGWSSYTFWQYTSSASVPGISGNVDMSQYCCDPGSLQALAYAGTRWSNWYPLGGQASGRVALAPDRDGRLEGFVRAVDGSVRHIWQTAQNGGWTSWYSHNGSSAGDPTMARNADGRLEVWIVGIDGRLYHSWQTQGPWSQWSPIAGSFTGKPTVVANPDGRLEAFARGADGGVWHTWQTSPNGVWTAAYPLGGSTTGDPAAGANADGRLEVFARQPDGSLGHVWQLAVNGGWGGWGSLGGSLVGSPSVGSNGDGRLEAFARGTNNALWHSWQTTPNGSWYPFTSMGGNFNSDPTIARNASPRLEAFVVDSQGVVEHTYQAQPNGLWVPWGTFPGFVAGSPPGVAPNADGRLELLIRGAGDNSVWHVWQTAVNGGL